MKYYHVIIILFVFLILVGISYLAINRGWIKLRKSNKDKDGNIVFTPDLFYNGEKERSLEEEDEEILMKGDEFTTVLLNKKGKNSRGD